MNTFIMNTQNLVMIITLKGYFRELFQINGINVSKIQDMIIFQVNKKT